MSRKRLDLIVSTGGLATAVLFAVLGVALSVSGPKVLGHATNLVFEGVFRKLKGGEGIDFHALAMTALVAVLLYLASYAFGYAQAWMLAGVVQRTMSAALSNMLSSG